MKILSIKRWITHTHILLKYKAVECYKHDLSFSQIKTVINYCFGGLKMVKKNEDKKDKMLNIVGSDDQNAGICGPDGCVINWDKYKKNDVKKK